MPQPAAMRLVLTLFFVMLAGLAHAGAWPRGAGKAFVASSVDQDHARVFSEYGIRGDWTLGIESALPFGRNLPDITLSLSHPVWKGKGGAILSAGVAVERRGALTFDGRGFVLWEPETAVRAGLFLGYGFQSRFGNGWAVAEAQIEHSLPRSSGGVTASAVKLDLTLGLRPTDRLLIMAQLQTMQVIGGQRFVRLETTTGLKFGNRTLIFAPSYPVGAPGPIRLKLGLWMEF